MKKFLKDQLIALTVKEDWIRSVSFILPKDCLELFQDISKELGYRTISHWKDFVTTNYLCSGIEVNLLIWVTPLSTGNIQITVHRLKEDYFRHLILVHKL